jgi:hypothetical protein
MAKQVTIFLKIIFLRLRKNIYDDGRSIRCKLRINLLIIKEIEKGIIPRSFNHIVNIIDSTQNNKYLVRCSYIEIYNEEVHDLLGKGIDSILYHRC